MNRKSLETLKWKIMEVKKSPQADLENKKNIFLENDFLEFFFLGKFYFFESFFLRN